METETFSIRHQDTTEPDDKEEVNINGTITHKKEIPPLLQDQAYMHYIKTQYRALLTQFPDMEISLLERGSQGNEFFQDFCIERETEDLNYSAMQWWKEPRGEQPTTLTWSPMTLGLEQRVFVGKAIAWGLGQPEALRLRGVGLRNTITEMVHSMNRKHLIPNGSVDAFVDSVEKWTKKNRPENTPPSTTCKLAFSIINMVIDRLEEEHPIIAELAKLQGTKSLLHGEAYYYVEDDVAAEITDYIDTQGSRIITRPDIDTTFKARFNRLPTDEEIQRIQDNVGHNFSRIQEDIASAVDDLYEELNPK